MMPVRGRLRWAGAIALLALACLAGDSRLAHAAEAAPAATEAAGDAAGKAFEPKQGAQKFTFQAEVSRLMDIIIHSLYSNKDIYLRELISNASDALDKLRFLALTDKAQLGDTPDLAIQLKANKTAGTLEIRDTGVGMTKEDLVKNLGTIAKSGTSAFLEQMQKGGDINLIGQFGVGFYAAYLVADYVEVVSKHNDDKQHIWESAADGNFAVSEDKAGEPLGRGTLIRLHIKEDAQESLEETKLRDLVARYSEFISFPIQLWASKEIETEVEPEEKSEEEKEKEAAEKKGKEEGVEDAKDEEEEEEEPQKVKTRVWDWETLNGGSALWLRAPGDVTPEDHANFYKALVKNDYDKALDHIHFRAEGDVEFRALLYIPERPPPSYLNEQSAGPAGMKDTTPALRLYVRRVFISDDFEELIPRYMSFLRGVVDSDSLPLSVSREALQAHSSLKVIRKKLVRKTLDALKRMAEGPEAGGEEGEAGAGGAAPSYEAFWKAYSKAIKLGVIEDSPNRGRLAKLLRFHSSKSPANLTSLDEYVARMPAGQKEIYYLAGDSVEALQKSPFLEKLLEKGHEVIFFTEALDEYVMGHLTEFDDKKFQNASKDNLKLGKGDKASLKKAKEELKELVGWWKELLGPGVAGVKVSARLATSPAIVVTSQYGWSANMERIMRSQALGDAESKAYMRGQKTLEINPRHPLIQELRKQHAKAPEGDKVRGFARLLYDTALLESGFELEAPAVFNAQVHRLLADAYGIKGEIGVSAAQAEAAAAAEAAEKEEEEEPAAGAAGDALADAKDEL